MRWPEGFECPRCGHDHGWALRGKAHTFECARCHRQTSVTAGTILHGSKLALTVWFWAAYLMATHSNGIAALQLQNQLGIGSYRSAWLLAAKLRKAMVDPERDPLSGLIEVDETALAFRTKNDPVAGGAGRSHDGKLLVVGASRSATATRRAVRLTADAWSAPKWTSTEKFIMDAKTEPTSCFWIHQVFSRSVLT